MVYRVSIGGEGSGKAKAPPIGYFDAAADKPTVVAKNPPLGEKVAATPAIADDTLYVRTAGHLYAFAEKK